MVQKKLRGVVAYMSTGHGFKSPAVAIAKALEAQGVDVDCVDLLEEVGEEKANSFIKRSWDFYLRNPWTFVVTFFLLNGRIVHLVQRGFANRVRKSIVAYLRRRQPDFILTTHFVLAASVQRALGTSRLPVAFFGYNSEVIISHRSYIAKKVHRYLVSTEQGREGMIRQGMAPEQVITTSFPLDPKFNKEFGERVDERKKLGLRDMFTLVVSFGGLGVGSYEFIERIARSDLNIQIVVICGKNEEAVARIEEMAARHPDANLLARGFVTNMQDYLYCCDISAGKAGLNMVFESIYMQRPFLALMAMANERFCAQFVVDHGFGWYAKSEDQAIDVVRRAVEDYSFLDPYSERLASHRINYNTQNLAQTIMDETHAWKRERLADSETLFFDLAGTLCDIPIGNIWEEINLGGIRRAFEVLELHHDRSEDEIEELCKAFVDRKAVLRKEAKETLKEFEIQAQIRDFLTERGIETASADWDAVESAFVSTELEITVGFSGVREVLTELRKGYRLHLLSNNASTRLVLQILEKIHLSDCFETVIVSADLGVRKPDPGFFTKSLTETGADPAKTVMIGDRLTQDIVMANDAGIASVYCAMVEHQDNAGGEQTPYTTSISNLEELLQLFPRRTLPS